MGTRTEYSGTYLEGTQGKMCVVNFPTMTTLHHRHMYNEKTSILTGTSTINKAFTVLGI